MTGVWKYYCYVKLVAELSLNSKLVNLFSLVGFFSGVANIDHENIAPCYCAVVFSKD